MLDPIEIFPQLTSAELAFVQTIADTAYADGELIIGNSSTGGVSIATLTAGSGIVITNGHGSITISASGSSFAGSQEKSTTSPDGSTQTFVFTHPPKMIFWNSALQTLTDDYTVSSNTITFTGTNTPQTGDKIINIYA